MLFMLEGGGFWWDRDTRRPIKGQRTSKMLWNRREDPKNLELIYFKKCIYSFMFKLQLPSKYSPSDAIHLLRLFPTAQAVFELIDFDAF